MKFQMHQELLVAGLSLVTRTVATRTTVPVLENVLIATDSGRVRLSATNLSASVSTWILARIEEEGAITLPARLFTDLVSALPKDEITLSLPRPGAGASGQGKTNTVTLKAGGSKSQIKGIEASEFPPLPVPTEDEGITLPAGTWAELISLVAFAASTDEARPALNGIYLSTESDLLNLVAADGFRIAVSQQKLSSALKKPLDLIIPTKALIELARILKDREAEESVTMTWKHRTQVIFQTTNLVFSAQVVDASYVPWRQVVPAKFKTRTVVPSKAFATAVKQAEVFARENKHTITLRVKTQEGKSTVDFVAQGEEVGETAVRLDAAGEGEVIIAFNGAFLKQAVDAIRTPELAIQTLGTSTNPGMISPVGQDNCYTVLMPLFKDDIEAAAKIADAIEAAPTLP